MKVKIGNKIYDGNKEPIMLILDDSDKADISNMAKEDRKYLHYPTEMPKEQAEEFMRDRNIQKMG